MKETLPADGDASGPFASLPATSQVPVRPLTRKHGRQEKTTVMKVKEGTMIGLPIFLVLGFLFWLATYFYNGVIAAIAEVNVKFELFRKDVSSDHDKLIRVETLRETDRQTAESKIQMLDVKVQTLAEQLSKKR